MEITDHERRHLVGSLNANIETFKRGKPTLLSFLMNKKCNEIIKYLLN